MGSPSLSNSVLPLLITNHNRYGNINPLSIGYGFRPRLRTDSPPVDERCGGTLTLSVSRIPIWIALLMPAFSLLGSPRSIPLPLHQCQERSPTTNPSPQTRINSQLRYYALAPLHCRRKVFKPVSCYALFKGLLPPSKPPGCLKNLTSFSTEHRFGDLSLRSGLFPSRTRRLAAAY